MYSSDSMKFFVLILNKNENRNLIRLLRMLCAMELKKSSKKVTRVFLAVTLPVSLLNTSKSLNINQFRLTKPVIYGIKCRVLRRFNFPCMVLIGEDQSLWQKRTRGKAMPCVLTNTRRSSHRNNTRRRLLAPLDRRLRRCDHRNIFLIFILPPLFPLPIRRQW